MRSARSGARQGGAGRSFWDDSGTHGATVHRSYHAAAAVVAVAACVHCTVLTHRVWRDSVCMGRCAKARARAPAKHCAG